MRPILGLPPQLPPITTAPNLVSLSGLAMSVIWLLGGSPAWAVGSIIADEVDGRLARKLNQESEFGSNLDWAIDMTLGGLVMNRLGLLAWYPLVVPFQVAARSQGVRPPILGFRQLITAWALYQENQ